MKPLILLDEHACPTRFKPGQRVRPSEYGIERCIFAKTRHNQTGVVVKVDRWNCPTVRWQGQKGAKGYFSGFIAPDRRRKVPVERTHIRADGSRHCKRCHLDNPNTRTCKVAKGDDCPMRRMFHRSKIARRWRTLQRAEGAWPS